MRINREQNKKFDSKKKEWVLAPALKHVEDSIFLGIRAKFRDVNGGYEQPPPSTPAVGNGVTGSAATVSPVNLPSDGSQGASTGNGLSSAAAQSFSESESGGRPLGIKKQNTAAAAAKEKFTSDGKTASSLRLASEAMDRFAENRHNLKKPRVQLNEINIYFV